MDEIVPIYLTDRQAYKYTHWLFEVAESLFMDDEAKFQLMELVDLLLKAQNLSFEKFLSIRALIDKQESD